jgi:hypothetical protein
MEMRELTMDTRSAGDPTPPTSAASKKTGPASHPGRAGTLAPARLLLRVDGAFEAVLGVLLVSNPATGLYAALDLPDPATRPVVVIVGLLLLPLLPILWRASRAAARVRAGACRRQWGERARLRAVGPDLARGLPPGRCRLRPGCGGNPRRTVGTASSGRTRRTRRSLIPCGVEAGLQTDVAGFGAGGEQRHGGVEHLLWRDRLEAGARVAQIVDPGRVVAEEVEARAAR